MLYSLGGNTNYMRVFSQRDWNFFLYLLVEVIAIKKYCSSSFRGVWRGVALLHTNSWKLVKAHHDFRRFKFFIRARIAESRVEKFLSPIRFENPSINGWIPSRVIEILSIPNETLLNGNFRISPIRNGKHFHKLDKFPTLPDRKNFRFACVSTRIYLGNVTEGREGLISSWYLFSEIRNHILARVEQFCPIPFHEKGCVVHQPRRPHRLQLCRSCVRCR